MAGARGWAAKQTGGWRIAGARGWAAKQTAG